MGHPPGKRGTPPALPGGGVGVVGVPGTVLGRRAAAVVQRRLRAVVRRAAACQGHPAAPSAPPEPPLAGGTPKSPPFGWGTPLSTPFSVSYFSPVTSVSPKVPSQPGPSPFKSPQCPLCVPPTPVPSVPGVLPVPVSPQTPPCPLKIPLHPPRIPLILVPSILPRPPNVPPHPSPSPGPPQCPLNPRPPHPCVTPTFGVLYTGVGIFHAIQFLALSVLLVKIPFGLCLEVILTVKTVGGGQVGIG